MLFTAEMLLNYQRCNRRAFLDVYGDTQQKDSPSDYLLKLFQDSIDNHRNLLSQTDYQQPNYRSHDWAAGSQATLALMQQGVDRIYQPVLRTQENGITLISVPDLLIKRPGYSIFGDWLYIPEEIKLSKRAKTEYQIIVAYHVKVLAAVQGAWPEEAFLNLKDKGQFPVDLWELIPRMDELLTDCIHAFQSPQEPEVFISRNRCSLCHWYNHCYEVAKTENHLSLLPGVTQGRYNELLRLNITTLETLATTPPKRLETLPGFGFEAALRIIRQAQATLSDVALPADDFPSHHKQARFLEQDLPTAPIELYFDIESEPSLDLIYLHGVLVVDRIHQTTQFHALLADKPEDEEKVWREFLELVYAYPNAPIFHFCPYETQTVGKLAKTYAADEASIQTLLSRFIDLHVLVTQIATLPVESYALKNIAKWMGFNWRDATANGAQSIYWYAQWLATQERSYLDSIVTYNEDDCRATHHIKDWLVQFVQDVRQELIAS